MNRPIALLQNALTTDYSDPFTVRVSQVVGGLYRKGNARGLALAVQQMPDEGAVLEIGAFTGFSTILIAYFMRKFGKGNLFFTCDRWNYQFKGLDRTPLAPFAPVTGEEWGRFAKETFIKNVEFFCRGAWLPHAVEMWSGEFFDAWERQEAITDLFGRTVRLGSESLSFCFIDGNHDYEAVKADFESCDRYLRWGGLIFLDDSADYTGSPGVRRLISDLKRDGTIGRRYKIVAKTPNYLLSKVFDGV